MNQNIDIIIDFKNKYKSFNEAIIYINKNIKELEKDPVKWEKIKKNLKRKFEIPLDESWDKLSDEQKIKFNTLYGFNRWKAEKGMEEINVALDVFNGKIIKVEERKKENE